MKHRRELKANFLHFETSGMPMAVGAHAGLDLAKRCPGERYPGAKAPMAAPLRRADRYAHQRALMRWDRSKPTRVQVDLVNPEHRTVAALNQAGDEATHHHRRTDAVCSSKELAHARRVPTGAAMRVLG